MLQAAIGTFLEPELKYAASPRFLTCFKILKEMPNSTKKERLDEEDKLIEKWNKGQLLNKQKKPPLLFGIVN